MDCCENPMALGCVVCPKPRRAGQSNVNNNTAMPLRFHIRNDVEAFGSKAGAELLGLILHKEDVKAERCASLSSSPPFFFGSPPCRCPNPVVQDVHFGDQKLTSKCSSSPSGSASPPSAQTRLQFGKKQAAVVRVEGFDSQSSHFVAMT
ncbi:hypothetical protein BUALT_Bualt04G0081500 [Buddleja alternifolia]|uniref:Uncharacterized protein n=1 Tax=Buddleja alternifolia TaxID=168488 RepID=A0AAV6XM75_9LAMI|nr:hypothetical protein BUALT_Bualt04G0081500 [Buddleja alternifolia]